MIRLRTAWLRSLLFVPGNRADMLAKAARFAPDAFVPDLEDSVPPAEKAAARQAVAGGLEALAATGRVIIGRINGLGTQHYEADLDALLSPHIDAVAVPKVQSRSDIESVSEMIERRELASGWPVGRIGILAMVESALGWVTSFEIAGASPRVWALAFGREDYSMDLGIDRPNGSSVTGDVGAGEPGIDFGRAGLVVAARAAGCRAIDAPHLRLDDDAGLSQDVQQGRRLGFDGKFAIHPAQLEAIGAAFSPSPQQVERARSIVAAAAAAESAGRGAVSLDGQVLDAPVVEKARRTLTAAEAGPDGVQT